jgi:hypothetical protein
MTPRYLAGVHTSPDLYDVYRYAVDRRHDGPLHEPRQEFDNLRNRMDLPENWRGPIHHEQFPIHENPGLATAADNLYATASRLATVFAELARAI